MALALVFAAGDGSLPGRGPLRSYGWDLLFPGPEGSPRDLAISAAMSALGWKSAAANGSPLLCVSAARAVPRGLLPLLCIHARSFFQQAVHIF